MSEVAHIIAVHREPRQLQALLYRTSSIVPTPSLQGVRTLAGSQVAIVRAPADRAQGQADRLSSGLIGARVAYSDAEIATALDEMADVPATKTLSEIARAA